jgi:hypothetical protein
MIFKCHGLLISLPRIHGLKSLDGDVTHFIRHKLLRASHQVHTFLQVTWIVCRKFHFQCFNYLDKNGKGTVLRQNAVKCVPATAFVAADHLGQLIVTDGMPREGVDEINLFGWLVSNIRLKLPQGLPGSFPVYPSQVRVFSKDSCTVGPVDIQASASNVLGK